MTEGGPSADPLKKNSFTDFKTVNPINSFCPVEIRTYDECRTVGSSFTRRWPEEPDFGTSYSTGPDP